MVKRVAEAVLRGIFGLAWGELGAGRGDNNIYVHCTAAPPRLRLVSSPLSCRWAKAQKLLESVSALSLLRKYMMRLTIVLVTGKFIFPTTI